MWWDALIAAISAAVVSRAGDDAGKAAQSTWTWLFRTLRNRLGPQAELIEAGDERALEQALRQIAADDPTFPARLQSLRLQAQQGSRIEMIVPSPALPVRTAARQLPPGPVDFVNRTSEMSTLDDIVGAGEPGSTPVVIFRGPPGGGKISLVLRWGHKRQEWFRGGQFYADLRQPTGAVPGGPELVDEALTSFLTAMGVPSSALPTSFAGRLSLFRTLSAEDPVLVVVHGPTLPAQVTPLIPTAAGSLVLVSAQQDVGGLAMDGARFIDVGPLDKQAALALLAAGCGSDRIDTDPAAAERLVESCGRLAIAVRVVASRLHLDPTMTVAELADEVAAESYILDAMSLPDGSRAVELPFTNAYRYLTADAQRLYRDLGVLPVGEVADELLARVGWPDRTVRRAAIAELLGMKLVERLGPDRYTQHPLIRAHAAHHAGETAPGHAERVVADAVEYVCELAQHADQAIMGSRRRRATQPTTRDSPFTGPTARATALRALEQRRADLLQVARVAMADGAYRRVTQLAEASNALYLNHRHLADWIEMSTLAIAAARQLHRHDIEAQIRCALSRAYADAGKLDRARVEIDTALALLPHIDDPILVGTIWEFNSRYLDLVARAAPEADRAQACARAEAAFETAIDRYVDAAERAARAHRPDDERDAQRGAALSRLFLGAFLNATGRPGDALPPLHTAREGLNAVDDDRNSARADAAIGTAHLHLGHNRQAYDELAAAAAYFATAELWHYEADVRENLARAATALGDRAAADEHTRRAADIRRVSNPER